MSRLSLRDHRPGSLVEPNDQFNVQHEVHLSHPAGIEQCDVLHGNAVPRRTRPIHAQRSTSAERLGREQSSMHTEDPALCEQRLHAADCRRSRDDRSVHSLHRGATNETVRSTGETEQSLFQSHAGTGVHAFLRSAGMSAGDHDLPVGHRHDEHGRNQPEQRQTAAHPQGLPRHRAAIEALAQSRCVPWLR